MNGEIREGSVSKGEASGGEEEERLEKTKKNGGRQFFTCDHFFVPSLVE